jgi:fatty-acyl-CoA synthase
MNLPLTPVRFKERAARLFAAKVGVVCGGRRFTYHEFADRVDRLSAALLRQGVGPGDRVAFLSLNCHRLLEAYFGVVQLGAILVPLNVRLTPADFAYILNDAGADPLFLEAEFLPAWRQIRDDLKTVRRAILLADAAEGPADTDGNYEALLAREASPSPPAVPIADDAVAEVFYTSGTTGHPKGVMLTHRNLYLHALYTALALQYGDGDVQIHTIPLFHVNGWGTPQFLTMVGGTHVMLRRFDPHELCALVERERATRFFLVPTMAHTLVNTPGLDTFDLSSLQRVVVGGAPAPPVLFQRLEERLGCLCHAGYGLSETTPVLTMAVPQAHRLESAKARYWRQAMTGQEVPGVEIRVVDERGQDVPHDGAAIGEIVVRSEVVMAGYWNQPEETARVIRDGWFHTGDMAVWDADRYILIVDRQKDIIISGGENIASVEIENVFYGHPAVLEAVVIAVPDDHWGEVPKAVVVLREGAAATEAELLAFCRERLANFKVPRSVDFVASLPKGGTGKILKGEIRERYWAAKAKRVH